MSEQADLSDLSKDDLRTPFEKFEDLARRAFQTPKAVVEERMAEEKEARKQKRITKSKTCHEDPASPHV